MVPSLTPRVTSPTSSRQRSASSSPAWRCVLGEVSEMTYASLIRRVLMRDGRQNLFFCSETQSPAIFANSELIDVRVGSRTARFVHSDASVGAGLEGGAAATRPESTAPLPGAAADRLGELVERRYFLTAELHSHHALCALDAVGLHALEVEIGDDGAVLDEFAVHSGRLAVVDHLRGVPPRKFCFQVALQSA